MPKGNAHGDAAHRVYSRPDSLHFPYERLPVFRKKERVHCTIRALTDATGILTCANPRTHQPPNMFYAAKDESVTGKVTPSHKNSDTVSTMVSTPLSDRR